MILTIVIALALTVWVFFPRRLLVTSEPLIRPAIVAVDIRNAYLCVSCDMVVNSTHCPICGSNKLNYPLTYWIKPVPHE